MLGPGNEEAAMEALKAYPGGMQVGGGINPTNAQKYLDAGASHVIVTSYIFQDGKLDMARCSTSSPSNPPRPPHIPHHYSRTAQEVLLHCPKTACNLSVVMQAQLHYARARAWLFGMRVHWTDSPKCSQSLHACCTVMLGLPLGCASRPLFLSSSSTRGSS
jgi:hypothetical protein